MKLRTGILVPVFAVFMAGTSFSQAEIHSGIIHVQSDVEESNLIKLHCDALQDSHISSLVLHEFSKYSDEIVSTDLDVVNKKIYVKYKSSMTPNMLLGILERVVVKAYYLENGTPVYYSKTGGESYKR